MLVRFNKLPDPFMIVVDEASRPIGTLTDGDVRRGLLSGLSVEAPAEQFMNATPLIVRQADIETFNLPRNRQITFVPIVDESGRLIEIWLPRRSHHIEVDAMVMAGGFGRRMGERTRSIPKPLLKVGGRPLIEHTLSWLEAAPVKHIYVSVHYLAEQVEAYIGQRALSAEYSFVREEHPLGTAGALGLVSKDLVRPIIVVNADVLTRLDISALIDFHTTHGNDCTLVVAPYKIDIPFGVIEQDDAGNFAGIAEKPSYSHFISSGIYLLTPEFARLIQAGAAIDMPQLLMLGRKAGMRIGLFPAHEYWRDVGRESDYQEAQADHD